MGTVGLNFGSATSGAGFDVTSTVTQILGIETGVETTWKTQIKAAQAQDAVLTTLGTGLASLSTALGALTSFDGVLSAKQGASSNTDVLTLTSASPAAVAGSHTVVVSSLASTASKYSDRITNKADVLTGSLTIQVGSGAALAVDLGSGKTLAQLASSINQSSFGVTASLVTDTDGSRLSIVSKLSGAVGELTLGGTLTDSATTSAIGFSVGQAGADAQLTVDGLPTTSASNTVTGAIPGVTFQLLQAAPGSTLQVQITNDNSSVVTAVQALVTAYNSVASGIRAQEGKDTAGTAQPLYGSPTLALLQNQLASALTSGASGSVTSLAQLGIALGSDGQLTLTASTLQSALNTNFDDVTGYLQGTGGLGQTLTSTLNTLSSTSSKGAITLALAENATRESSLNGNIAAVEARAAIDKTKLTKELNLANQILQSIPSQLNEIDQIYSALTGYNTKG